MPPSLLRWKGAIAILAIGCAACVPATPPSVVPVAPAAPPICHDCFWRYQPEALRPELAGVYGERRYPDPLIDAQRRMLLARVKDDDGAFCAARADLAKRRESDPARALVAAEASAFAAARCSAGAARAFRKAARAARRAGEAWKAEVYASVAAGRFAPAFGSFEIARHLDVPPGTTAFVLGESKIVLAPGERVGAQVERTVRDWLSYQLDWDETAAPVPKKALLTWHEGARLRDLLDAAPEEVLPLTGTLAAWRDGHWYAADETGVFRFEVLDDKIQYPTTLAYGGLALLRDTHGISALVEPAVRRHVDAVIGCGDAVPKMEAAVWLAQRGISAWFPCDRFVGDILGYEGKGVLLGSAPVRAQDGRAVVGDRPVTFSASETIVAEDFTGIGVARYYDAPARYFEALAEALPSLKVVQVDVDGPGESDRIVARAEALGATAIAVRVETKEDAAPVRAWLSGARERRAVLFHTAPYPAGYALFAEFPGQTTFGDPRPRFLGAPSGTPAAASDPMPSASGSRPRTP